MERYARVRATSERLCEPLAIEDFVPQPVVETSPPRWHLAHVTWFFETFLLRPYLADYRVFHDRYAFLFNSYYEQTGTGFWPRPQRGLLSRPTVAEVFDYRRHVDAGMAALIEQCPESLWPEVSQRLEIGLNHEQQHQELLVTDIKFNFGFNPLRPAYRTDLPTPPFAKSRPAAFVTFDAGIVEIGATEEGFGWDNERPSHRCFLEPFALATRLVNNADYLAFIDDGGYSNPALWLSEGWAVVQAEAWRAPLYWEQVEDEWRVMTLGGLRRFNPAEPVCHLSYYEADAFAAWAGKRLPTEVEWEHAAREVPVAGNFLEQGWLHPHPPDDGPSIKQLFGDVWEWTGSAYLPYPGYRAAAGALGEYNGKFMCSQMVLRGGSCATAGDHIRASYRNFFYPRERWQLTGLRLAETIR